MARPAADMDLPVAELHVNVGYQLNHLAGLHLGGLGVERAVRLVAEVAASLVLDAQRGRVGLHLSHKVLRRQHFKILGRRVLACRLALGVEGSLMDHDGRQDRHRGEHRKVTPEFSHGENYSTGQFTEGVKFRDDSFDPNLSAME